jgi:lipopolysaccharide export system permease protein
MSRSLALYVSRLFLARFAMCLLALAGLLQLLDLLDSAKDILARENSGISTILYYARLRFPSLIVQMGSVATLLAALVTLVTLVQRNEIIAMKSIGISYFRLLLSFTPAAALVAAFHFAVGEWVAPHTDRELQLWWEATAPRGSDDTHATQTVSWVRRADAIVSVTTIQLPGRHLEGLRIFDLDDAGELVTVTLAERADYVDGQWRLEGVQEIDRRANNRPMDSMVWETDLKPVDFAELALPPRQYSIASLVSLSERSKVGARNVRFYEAMLQKKFATPVATFLMVLIAAPVAQTSRRRGGTGYAFGLGVIIGFAFFVTDGLVLVAGESGMFPTVFAAWAPTILFTSVAGTILVHTER